MLPGVANVLLREAVVPPYEVLAVLLTERLPPVWLARARMGADAGVNSLRSDDCHATEIGLANAIVTDASPGS